MMDLIDRSEVLYNFAEILPEADDIEWYKQTKPDEVKDLVDEMYSIVLSVNRIEAQPVKLGKWVKYPSIYRCSNCGNPKGTPKPYCELCGARMSDHFADASKMVEETNQSRF